MGMQFHVADPADAKRVAKILRKRLAEAGADASLSSCQDALAAMYGFSHWHEMAAGFGRHRASEVDEASDPDTAAARRRRQVEIIRDRFPAVAARAEKIATDVRATGRRSGSAVPLFAEDTSPKFPERLAKLLLGDLDQFVQMDEAAALVHKSHLLGGEMKQLGATWASALLHDAETITMPDPAFYQAVRERLAAFGAENAWEFKFFLPGRRIRLWSDGWPYVRTPDSILRCLDDIAEAAAAGQTLEGLALALAQSDGASWPKIQYDGGKLARSWREFMDHLLYETVPAAVSYAGRGDLRENGVAAAFDDLARSSSGLLRLRWYECLPINETEVFRRAIADEAFATRCRRIAGMFVPAHELAADADRRWEEGGRAANGRSEIRAPSPIRMPRGNGGPYPAWLPESFAGAASLMQMGHQPSEPERRAFMAYEIAASDLDLAAMLDGELWPVDDLLSAYRRGLNLLDLAATWLDEFTKDALGRSDEAHVITPERLVARAREGVAPAGRVDAGLAEFVQGCEITWAFQYISYLGGDQDGLDMNGGLRRLVDAHARGVTLEDLARAAWRLLAVEEEDGDFEMYRDHPDDVRQVWHAEALTDLAEAEAAAAAAGPLSPDYDDPFAVRPADGKRMVGCLHCGDSYRAEEIVYENRAGSALWWCRNKSCDGAGLGWGIHFT